MSDAGVERVVVASTGGWQFVGTRYRLGPLARAGRWPVDAFSADPFPSSDQLERVVTAGGPGAVLVLQRVIPQANELARLRAAYDRILFDVDDAIHAVPPRVGEPVPTRFAKGALRTVARGSPRASSRRRPLARTLRGVDLCVVGNPILGRFAGRFAPEVVEIPTTVDPVDHAPATRPNGPTFAWLGLRDNLQYLELLRAPLRELARREDFVLRVVSTETWADAPVPVDFVPFSEEAATEALLTATAGLSPLTDDPWTRGKCAMRAIQYGAHALPAVATPVGITDRVVIDGETGFLPRSSREWLHSLRSLARDPSAAAEMGASGLEHIRRHYSNAMAAELWIDAIVGRDRPSGE